VNSTQFTTVLPATASFLLNSTAFQPLTDQLNLTIVNFNSSGVFAFTYELYVESLLDPMTMFSTGFANLTNLTNFVILFSLPFTQADVNIKFTARLYTPYSDIYYVNYLSSTSSAAGLPANKLSIIDSSIAWVNTQNYSLLTKSFNLVVGQPYIWAPVTNPCSTCLNAVCKTYQNNTVNCICKSFYNGQYCEYPTTIWNEVQSIQSKLISFLKSNSRRRLLATSLASLDKLQIILSVAMYPDALTPSLLVSLQNSLDSITAVGSFNEADMYVQVVTYIAAAANSLGVDLTSYIQSKLVTAGQLMKSYLAQPLYYLYQNNIEFRMVNSDYYFKQTLLSNSVPLLNFTMSLWSVNFPYQNLQQGAYTSALYPYGAAIFLSSTSWFYFDAGNGQKVNVSLQLPVLLNSSQSSQYQCQGNDGSTSNINNNSCAAYSVTWEQFKWRSPPVVPAKSFGMLGYGLVVYAAVLALVIAAEILYRKRKPDMIRVL